MQNRPGSSSNAAVSVLIVDASAMMRGMVATALESNPGIKVIGSAANREHALQTTKRYQPDVVILDLASLGQDTFSAMPQLLSIAPDLRIIITAASDEQNISALQTAIEMGAAAFIHKPDIYNQKSKDHFRQDLCEKVLGLRHTPLINAATAPALPKKAPHITATPISPHTLSARVDIICFGASTGGPHALMQVFSRFKGKKFNVPIVVVVHIPATFAEIQAKHLSQVSGLPAHVGEDDMPLQAGHIYVALGGKHLRVIQKQPGSSPVFRLGDDEPVNFCRPAVDVTFNSVAEIYGKHTLAIVLTGMGQDGAAGAKTLANMGARILVQERSSCVVWGMPRAVLEMQVPAREESLAAIADAIIQQMERGQ